MLFMIMAIRDNKKELSAVDKFIAANNAIEVEKLIEECSPYLILDKDYRIIDLEHWKEG